MNRTNKPKRGRGKRRGRRRPINVAASVITTFSLYCGAASIIASINLEFESAAYWILAAMVLDTLDGAVARLTKSISEFGKELDSLSDLVSFGVGPAVLIYTGYLREAQETQGLAGPTAEMIAITFVICGALRLARYNVFQSTRRDSFIGLPIPAAGGTIASFVLFTQYLEVTVSFWALGPLTLALAILMVTTIRYPKDRMRILILAPRMAFRFLTMCVLGIIVFHYANQHTPAIILMPLAAAYVLYGPVEEIYRFVRARGRRRPKPEDTETDPDAPNEPDNPPNAPLSTPPDAVYK